VIAECGLVGFFDLITMSEFETEETCRETLEFLLDFPREMKTVGFYPMIRFRDTATRGRSRRAAEVTLSTADYAYFHRLYLLTGRGFRGAGACARALRLLRRNPRLLDPLLPKTPAVLLPRQRGAQSARFDARAPG